MHGGEPNVNKRSTRAVLPTEAAVPLPLLMPSVADATQSAGVQHGQEEPALAVVLQRLHNMQAQLKAMQQSIVEAMAKAA